MGAFFIRRDAPFPKELFTGDEHALYRKMHFAELSEALADRLRASEREIFGAILQAAKVDGMLADELPTYILHAEKLGLKKESSA